MSETLTGLPQWLTKTIPSYLYQEYSDDDDLQAFVASYNTLAQMALNTFISLDLPIYTNVTIAGALLDWVIAGLYGYVRPALPSGLTRAIGPYDSWQFNEIPYNSTAVIGAINYVATSDDIYRRCLTWHFMKGDGKVFDIRWLKRRIMRFLTGLNGTNPNIDQTYQISITFGTGNIVEIRLINARRLLTGGALYDRFGYNQNTVSVYNATTTVGQFFTPLPNAEIFQAAIQALALELPFQFQWSVVIQDIAGNPGCWNDGGWLALFSLANYPASPVGLPPGAIWSNDFVVSVIPGVTPDPSATPVYFGSITAAQLLALGGGNLPLSNPGPGTLQLWNNSGIVSIA